MLFDEDSVATEWHNAEISASPKIYLFSSIALYYLQLSAFKITLHFFHKIYYISVSSKHPDTQQLNSRTNKLY